MRFTTNKTSVHRSTRTTVKKDAEELEVKLKKSLWKQQPAHGRRDLRDKRCRKNTAAQRIQGAAKEIVGA